MASNTSALALGTLIQNIHKRRGFLLGWTPLREDYKLSNIQSDGVNLRNPY